MTDPLSSCTPFGRKRTSSRSPELGQQAPQQPRPRDNKENEAPVAPVRSWARVVAPASERARPLEVIHSQKRRVGSTTKKKQVKRSPLKCRPENDGDDASNFLEACSTVAAAMARSVLEDDDWGDYEVTPRRDSFLHEDGPTDVAPRTRLSEERDPALKRKQRPVPDPAAFFESEKKQETCSEKLVLSSNGFATAKKTISFCPTTATPPCSAVPPTSAIAPTSASQAEDCDTANTSPSPRKFQRNWPESAPIKPKIDFTIRDDDDDDDDNFRAYGAKEEEEQHLQEEENIFLPLLLPPSKEHDDDEDDDKVSSSSSSSSSSEEVSSSSSSSDGEASISSSSSSSSSSSKSLSSTAVLVESTTILENVLSLQLIKKLGEGTFSEVFAAKSPLSPVCFAVKRAKRPFRTRKGRDLALAEARTLCALNSPHVLYCGGAWQEDGHLHLVLELCRQSVKELRPETALIESPALWRFARDVSAGLDHVHSLGFVHLDVKPSNVLLGADGSLKLADFGLCAIAGHTVDGTEGDARYLAPELLSYESFCDPKNDIFSLALTLYELARPTTFALPATGPRWHQLRQKNDGGLSFSEDADISEDLETLLRRAADPNPTERPTAHHILHHPLSQQAAMAPDCGTWLTMASTCPVDDIIHKQAPNAPATTPHNTTFKRLPSI